MEKEEFYAMFGVYFGNFYHGCDPVVNLAHHNWEFYEKSNFSDDSLEVIKNTLGTIKKYRPVYAQPIHNYKNK
jgi:hypothetical protein